MRDYKKENEWKKNKYIEIRANIDKELALSLKEKLKLNKITVAGWIKENAKKYIKEM